MHIKTKIPPPLVALTFGFLINYTKDIFPKIEIRNEIIFGSFMIIIGLIIILSAIILFKKYNNSFTSDFYTFILNKLLLALLFLSMLFHH